MALTIENASIGYDSNGVKELLQKIQTEVVDETIKLMNQESQAINYSVENYWVGNSADTFKGNIQHDVSVVSNSLHREKEELEKKLNEIAKLMGDKEAEVISSRG